MEMITSVILGLLVCCFCNTQAKAECDQLIVMDKQELVMVNVSTETVDVLNVDISGINDRNYFDIDLVSGRMYFIGLNKIWVADVDGTKAKEYITFNSSNTVTSGGIALDPIHQEMLIADASQNKIISISYPEPDPSDPSVFLTVQTLQTLQTSQTTQYSQAPNMIDLDIENQVVYLTVGSFVVKINYDGTDAEFLTLDLDYVYDVDVDNEDKEVYYMGLQNRKGQRVQIIGVMDLDGNETKILFNETDSYFTAMKPLGDYIYIAEHLEISRSRLVRMSKKGGSTEQVGKHHFEEIRDLASYCPDEPEDSAVCGCCVCD